MSRMFLPCRRALATVLAMVGMTAASDAEAVQAQQTFTACLVPSVGVIYMIKQLGLPDACLGEGHQEFSWMESAGSQADLEAHKTSSDHDARYATRAELADPGVVNTVSNLVDWTQLKNVPAGLADGVDHTGGTPTDLVCSGCVGTTDLGASSVGSSAIIDGSVRSAEIADGSITSNHIANGAITGDDIAIGTITSDDIANGTITGTDIATGSITGLDIQDGQISGSDIADGSVGSAELSSTAVTLEWETRDGTSISMSNGTNATRTVSCSSGWRVVSGQWDYSGTTPTNDFLFVHESYAQDSDSWFFRFYSGTNVQYTITPSITCIRLLM